MYLIFWFITNYYKVNINLIYFNFLIYDKLTNLFFVSQELFSSPSYLLSAQLPPHTTWCSSSYSLLVQLVLLLLLLLRLILLLGSSRWGWSSRWGLQSWVISKKLYLYIITLMMKVFMAMGRVASIPSIGPSIEGYYLLAVTTTNTNFTLVVYLLT
jgi:hypothetical protein